MLGTEAEGDLRTTLMEFDPCDSWAMVHNRQGRYGINNVRVILFSDGRIKTAYPVDGPKEVIVRPGP